MKRELNGIKQAIADLSRTTKADITELRQETKADLTEFRQETKIEFAKLRQETKADIAGLRQETKADIARVSKQIVANQAAAEKFKDEVIGAVRRSQSTILSQMDRFMMQTRKVSVDQTFLIHRMDNLEKRVGSLEARAQ